MNRHPWAVMIPSGLAVSIAVVPALAQVGTLRQPFPDVQEIEDLLPGAGVILGPASLYRPTSVTFIGDISGDGLGDIAVATGHPYNQRLPGHVYVVFGSREAPGVVDYASLDGTNGFQVPGEFTSLAGIGDLNHDGVDDFAIGSRYMPTVAGGLDAGRVYVIFGTPAGFPDRLRLHSLDGTNGFRIDGEYADGELGASVAGPGDMNGDGIDDLVVGAAGETHIPGRVSIIFGRDASSGRGFEPVESIESPDGERLVAVTGTSPFGQAAAGVSDFNGDGRPDLVLGGGSRAYVLFGRGPDAPWPETLNVFTLRGSEGVRMRAAPRSGLSISAGASVGEAGDINGDGLSDIVVGAPDAQLGYRSYAGNAFVVFGTSEQSDEEINFDDLDGSDGFAIWGATGAFPSFDIGEETGYSVSAASDLNNDGIDDVLIGVPGGDDILPGPFREGRAYAIFGRDDGFDASLDLRAFGPGDGIEFRGADAWDNLGISVASGGDFNGDGTNDLAIGARLADGPELAGEGRAYILFGRSVCAPDLDRDGALTIFDFLAFQNLFDAGDPAADFDRDGALTVFDFLAFQNAFGTGCG